MVIYEMTGESPLAIRQGGFFRMSIIYDKPFMSYNQLINLMESRNIVVNNRAQAERALRNLSYYTLVNGYKESFLYSKGSDSFVDGTTFEELFSLHMIDVSLSHFLFKYILLIEKGLKSRISYLISEQYGVRTDYSNNSHSSTDDYLNRKHYGNSPKRNNTIRDLTGILSGSRSIFQSDSLDHYRKHHNHIPPWILTTSLSFGETILWYDILNPQDKKTICDQFVADNSLTDNDKKEFVKISLNLLRIYRNTIAHEGRVISSLANIQLPKKTTLSLSRGIILEPEYNKSAYAKSGLHAIFVPLTVLLNDKYFFATMIEDLKHVIGPYMQQDVHINGKTIPELFNIPEDIIERLNKYYC